MTVKLFWKDAYMKEFDSRVERIEDSKLVLFETAFYPLGGGVQNDTGKLTINGKEYKVVDVRKKGDVILHQTEEAVEASPGDAVYGTIDWDRRYSLMRYHTAVHLLDGIVEKNYSKGGISGGTIFSDRARVDFSMDGLTREIVQKIIDEANAVSQEGHRVIAKEITQEEALAMPNLARTEPGRQLIMSMPIVRVVEIEGVDAQSDGGLHVANTKEIGKITLNKF